MTDHTLNRRALTFSLLAASLAASLAGPAFAQASPPPLSPDDQLLADEGVAYLQALDQARARFVQTDGRGGTTQGTVYLKRPGKARFAYDPPSGLTVVSNGSTVSAADSRLKTFSSYPLGMTPLSLFLAKTIRFDRGVRVTRVDRMTDGFSLTARDAQKKTAGQIVLTFASSPLALAGWTVTDAQGRTIRVQLENLTRVSGLDPSLFELKDPRSQNNGRPRP